MATTATVTGSRLVEDLPGRVAAWWSTSHDTNRERVHWSRSAGTGFALSIRVTCRPRPAGPWTKSKRPPVPRRCVGRGGVRSGARRACSLGQVAVVEAVSDFRDLDQRADPRAREHLGTFAGSVSLG